MKATSKVDDIVTISKKDKTHNSRVHKVRAKVELPFGILKKKYKALSTPNISDPIVLDNLVSFGIGCLNFKNKNT